MAYAIVYFDRCLGVADIQPHIRIRSGSLRAVLPAVDFEIEVEVEVVGW